MWKFFTYISINILLIILMPIWVSTYAQPVNRWIRFYDGHNEVDWVWDVFAIVEGGFALAGETYTDRQHNGFWLVVTDAVGEELWQQTYRDERFPGINNRCYSIIQTDDGGFLLGGESRDGFPRSHFSVLRVDSEGNRLWWRTYGGPGSARCNAVIELKSGEFVAVGQAPGLDAFGVMLDGDGNVIWENTYEGKRFGALRETQGGILFAGADNDWQTWLLKTNFEGEILWSQTYGSGSFWSLVSHRAGGFTAGGHLTGGEGGWYIAKVNDEGQQIWARTFDFGGNNWITCLTRMWDDGLGMVGRAGNGHNVGAVLRTDSPGNEMWRRLDHNRVGGNENSMDDYTSTVTGFDNMLIVAGSAERGEQRMIDGVLVKIALEVSPPTIWEYIPEELEFSTLLADSVFFAIVEAEDAQNDSLLYYWTFDQDTVGTDTSKTITFEELGDHFVECFVSDGDLADSVQWAVHVKEFFIRSFEPDNLELIIQRGIEIDFGIVVAALEEIEADNTWTLTHRNQQQEEIGNGDAVTVTFDQSGRHQLQALVSHEEESDEVTWIINVRSAVWSWWPSELDLSAYKDSTLEFVITPFNEDSDSLDFLWLLNEEPLDSDSASFLVTFSDVGLYQLTSIVRDGVEGDTISWMVNVQEWSFTADEADLADFPTSPVLYPASPNPFNSSVRLSMYLPKADHVSLSIFDINGREVWRLVDGNVGAGNQTFVWNASDFPAGVYVVRMVAGDALEMRKVVLVR